MTPNPVELSKTSLVTKIAFYALIAELAYLIPGPIIALILLWISYQIECFHRNFVEDEE